jgi:phage baseplate assembly protein W
MRTGVDRKTGMVLTGWAHCEQSIGVIVTTAIGSRVMRRDFGSDGPALQDRPMSAPSIFDHIMAIAEALRKWEPGFRLRKVNVLDARPEGTIVFEQRGDFYPNGHLGDYSLVERDRSATSGPFALTTLLGAGGNV